MNTVDIGVSIANNLRNVFGIILALSLGEAYKQVIRDTNNTPQEKSIHWDSLPSMFSFLLLLVPFFQGMARFLDYAYSVKVRPSNYGPFLLLDILAFTIEASLFFVMSRTLRLEQWGRFYSAVWFLLITDTAWGVFTITVRHIDTVKPWVWSNVVCFVALALIFLALRTRPKIGATAACGAMLLRTIADYATSWNFYFPK